VEVQHRNQEEEEGDDELYMDLDDEGVPSHDSPSSGLVSSVSDEDETPPPLARVRGVRPPILQAAPVQLPQPLVPFAQDDIVSVQKGDATFWLWRPSAHGNASG
jgi:hypothetical protein